MNNRRQSDKSIERLEQALAEETRTSAVLRDSLEQLREKVLEQQRRNVPVVPASLDDTMRVLTETRAALERVTAERDRLQKELSRIDSMQTDTIALPEDNSGDPVIHPALPSIEELMSVLGGMQGEEASTGSRPVLEHDGPAPELIAPELVFPGYGKDGRPGASGADHGRVLVFLDAQPPIKYPITRAVMTIGRSASADIQIDDDFISRVHARIVCEGDSVVIEDADSRNGIEVNSAEVTRHTLQHGDIIGFGTLRFTFIDTAKAEDR